MISCGLVPSPNPLPVGEGINRLRLQGVADAFVLQEHHHQANPQHAVGEVKQTEQTVATHRVSVLAHLDTDGKISICSIPIAADTVPLLISLANSVRRTSPAFATPIPNA